MTHPDHFQVLEKYLSELPADDPQKAQTKIKLILTCIDQAFSLDGQWKVTVLNGLNKLFEDCLSIKIRGKSSPEEREKS